MNIRGLTGLANIKNTCYMNAIVQCLASSGDFCSYLTSKRYENDIIPLDREKTITHNLAALLDMMWKSNCNVKPLGLKNAVNSLSGTFGDGHQHDSQEFLNFVLDAIHEETKYPVIINPNSIPPEILSFDKKQYKEDPEYNSSHKIEHIISKAYRRWKSHIKNSYSIITDKFTGIFYTSTSCRVCDYSSHIFEPFTSLSLSIDDENQRDLASCISSYFKEEILSDEYSCKKCKTKVPDCIKKTYIFELPHYLIIQLKRFNSKGRKKNTPITFPLNNLNMKDVFVDFRKINKYSYNLWAICNHENKHSNYGHYVSYCKSQLNGKWYKFNDEEVTNVEEDFLQEESMKEEVYILFYVKK